MKLKNILSSLLRNELNSQLNNYFLKVSFHSLLTHAFSMILNFISGIILAKIMGAEGYGFFTLIFTWVSVLSTFSLFGTEDLLVREVAKNNRENTPLIRWALKNVLLISLLLTNIAIIFLYYYLGQNNERFGLFSIGLFTVPIFSIILSLQAALKGKQLINASQLPDKIFRPILFLASLCGIYFFYQSQLTPKIAIIVNTGAHILVLLGLGFFFFSHFSLKNNVVDIQKVQRKEWAKSSLYFFMATFVALINVKADILMLGWLRNDSEVGIYNIASRFSDLTEFSLLFITPVIAPVLSKLYNQNNIAQLQKLVKTVLKINVLFCILLCTILAISGNYILNFFEGSFLEGYLPMMILCGGHLVNILAGPAGNVLCMCGKEKFAFYAGIIGTIANISFNLLLIPKFGMLGAATATAISFLVWNGLQAYFAKKELNINTSIIN